MREVSLAFKRVRINLEEVTIVDHDPAIFFTNAAFQFISETDIERQIASIAIVVMYEETVIDRRCVIFGRIVDRA